MTDQQWRQAWDLYQSASALPQDKRDIYIDSTTDDVEVRCEVRTMLGESTELAPLEMGEISEAFASTAANLIRQQESLSKQGGTFGRYRILKSIGRGGMGEVYEAADPELDRHVALKFLPAGSFDQPAAMARFKHEARSLSSINHPNIVTVHEVIQQNGQIAIVMELVEGQALRQMCGPDPMPLQRLTQIGLQIARALEAAHSRGVIHGDIKPENVMVRPDGYAKVLDFGLARRAEDTDPVAENVIGTLRYMAPEQMSKQPVTPASDLYSLGLVLYEMASGRHPFGGKPTFAAGMRSAGPQPPPPLHAQYPELPAALDSLILAMLQKNPGDRISSSMAVAQLQELARKTDPRTLKESSFNRRGLALTVCGAAAVLAGSIWWGTRVPAAPAVQTRPLTSQMGRESEPVISPDGNWIAFLWSGADGAGSNPKLYVKRPQTDTPLLLETGDSPHPIRALTFSPDGSRIAFRRQDGIFEVTRDGTHAAAKLAASEDHCQGTGLDWAPGGRTLLLAECPAGSRIPVVIEIDLSSGQRRKVTSPPTGTMGDFDPRYSPDGKQIAFRRAVQPVVEDLFVMTLGSKGDPIAISRDARGIAGLAWMPDGKSLLVSSQRSSGIFSLWLFSLNKPFEPVAFTQAGQHAKSPSVARKSKAGRAVWINQVIDHNIWEIPFDEVSRPQPKRLIASLQRDLDGNIGPDGRIAFRSDRSGVSEIWIAAPDGSGPVRATSMDGPLTGTPRWSPDGKYLAFDSRPAGNSDIYLLLCGPAGCQGTPRRLTDHPASDVMPSWSRDGKSIYFGSSRTGRREVWRILIDDGAKPEQVTRNGGYLGMESPDGRWLYYSKIVEHHGIWRMPLQQPGTAEESVAHLFDDYGAGSFVLTPDGKELVYLGSGKSTGVRAWNLITKKDRVLHDVKDRPIERGLSISRDGRRVIYSQLDRSDSNVMVADGLR